MRVGEWVVHLTAGPQGGQKRAVGPETRAIGSCDHLVWVWELNSGPLQEQVLLKGKPSLSPDASRHASPCQPHLNKIILILL